MINIPQYATKYEEACGRGLVSRLRFLWWFWHQIEVAGPVRAMCRPRRKPVGARGARARRKPNYRHKYAPGGRGNKWGGKFGDHRK